MEINVRVISLRVISTKRHSEVIFMDYNLKNESTTIVFYRYRPKGHPGSSRETSNKQELILKSLEPATDYVINVRAVNGKSRGDWSASVNVKTMSRKKPDGIYIYMLQTKLQNSD